MSSVLELPDHVQMIAYEEAQLLQQLRHRLPEGSAVSPAVTFLTRNELMQEAKGLLPAEDWDRYLLFADSLALEYEQDFRDIAQGFVFRSGLYSKGGITGLAKQSWRHVATSRLLNALIADTLAPRRSMWTNTMLQSRASSFMGRPLLCPHCLLSWDQWTWSTGAGLH